MKQYVASHLKDMNRQVVYKLIKEKGVTSKAELSKLTGISSPTVIKVVNFLQEKGLVIDIGEGEASIGRKPQMLTLNRKWMYSAAFVLEGDFLAMGIVDITGNVIHKRNMKVRTDFGYIMALISNLLVKQLLEEAGIEENRLFGIGIALPVIYDRDNHKIMGAPLVKEKDEIDISDYIQELSDKYHVMVVVENDANSQAIGEFEVSGGKAGDDLVLLSIGSGMGAGVILNGKLRRGAHDMCGEIGHMSYMENNSSDRRIPGQLEGRVGYKKLQEKFGIELMESQTELSGEVNSQVIAYLASALALCVNNISVFLDCEHVVLGGKLVEILGEPLIQRVNEYLRSQCITGIQTRMETSEDIGLIGIASLVINRKILEILTMDSEK